MSEQQLTENWRIHPAYPDYFVSDQGRIMRRTEATGTRPGRILKPTMLPKGALHIHLQNVVTGKNETCMVRRLVLETFEGPAPTGTCAIHLDGDPWNCALDNLDWAGEREDGIPLHVARVSERDVVRIFERRAMGETVSSIAKSYGYAYNGAIYQIIGRKTFAHVDVPRDLVRAAQAVDDRKVRS